MTVDITSTTNPKIKWLKSLHSNSTRRKEGVFLVEGAKEIAMALDGGYELQSAFLCPEVGADNTETLKQVQDDTFVTTISAECFEKVSYRSGSDGLIAVFHAKQRSLDELTFGDNPLFIVVESIEKPGNLGAIIRTADGVGADAVIVCDERTDVFNPNVIRSSVGTAFAKQVVAANGRDVYDFFEKHEVTAFGAALTDDAKVYTATDFRGSTALLFGTEHEGLSDFWIQKSQPVVIPMNGVNDSLNVSNAVAVVAYEALRQRNEQ